MKKGAATKFSHKKIELPGLESVYSYVASLSEVLWGNKENDGGQLRGRLPALFLSDERSDGGYIGLD